jgi:RHS repeat-associated protein
MDAALTPEQRIAQVEQQAKAEVGDDKDLKQQEEVASTSHYGSLAAGAAIAADGGPVGLAAYGAAVSGGYAGSWLADQIGAADGAAWAMEKFGMHRIGAGGPHPATIGDQVAHSYAFGGFLASIVVGALAAVAVGALIVATGGVAAVAVIGAAAAGGLVGGFLGSAIGGAAAQMGSRTGPITSGSPDVFINGKPVARMTDVAACSKESTPQPIIEGSQTIFVNGLPMARIGHKLLCDATVDEGAPSVLIDDTTVACAQPKPSIPLWARVAADWLGFLPVGKAAAWLGNKTRSPTASGRSPAKTTTCVDPVDVATGEFVEWRTDLRIPGALPIQWRRHYASRREPHPGFFGPRWLDSWSIGLRRAAPDAPTIDYHDDGGVVYTFHTPEEQLDAEHLRAPELVLRGTRRQPVLVDRDTGLATHFEWTGNRARLAAFSDASGNRCDFVYADDASGGTRLASLKHSDGWRLQLQWQSGCVAGVWLHEPDRAPIELVRYHHDERGRLIRSASLESGRLYYRYDADDRMIGWGDDSATHVSIAYNDLGRVSCVDTPGNLHSGRFEYDLEQRRTHVWEAGSGEAIDRSRCTTFTYNADELVVGERDPLGNETQTEWDAHHRVVAATDALGRVTRNQYDDAGRLTASIDAQGRKDEFQYDSEGRLVAVIDSHGRRFGRSFDDFGRIASETGVSGVETRYRYDDRGRLRAVATPTGDTRFHYDEQHRPCGRTLPNDAHESWRQNRLGQLDWHTDALGATTTFDYDLAGHTAEPAAEPPRAQAHVRPRRVVRADGSVLEQRYTQEGLLSEARDADGRAQNWQWGAFDLLTQHTDASGHSTRYRYGTGGRLTELINAAGQSWQWHYDDAGRVSEEIDYAGRRTRWERDALGRPLVRWQPDATPWRYDWDDRDRLLAIRAPDVRHEYAYDDKDQLIGARVWRGARLDSRLDLEYDAVGRVIAETHRCGDELPRRIAWRYDELGRLAARDGPLGETRYAFDALGLLGELHTAHGALHIARDAEGRQIERSSHPLAPAVPQPQDHFHLRQSHDKLGRLIHQQAGHAADRRFHWQHDRLTGVDDQRFGNVRWQLDARDQITAADFSGPQQTADDPSRLADGLGRVGQGRDHARERFAYDAVGNLATIGGAPVRYEGDVVVQGGHNRYAWDSNGRMIRRTEQRNGFRSRTWHYEWDSFNRLLAVTTPEGQRWRYVYDAFGRRRAKRCESPPPTGKRRPVLHKAEYLWDGPTVAAQWKTYADGTPEAPGQIQEWHYESGGFTPLAVVQQRGDQARMLHVVADINGAPRELLDNAGELVWAGQLDTWGNLARCHVQDADRAHRQQFLSGYRPAANDPVIDVELRFENQWADEESGLYYNLNRYYDPAIGQYASQDPMGPAGGIRTHGYVHNSTVWIDPWGLSECPPLITNKFPGEPLDPKGKIYGEATPTSDGRVSINRANLPRDVDYVITADKRLVIGSKHTTLANREDVLAAGQMKLSGNGTIRRIDNSSGHYRPSVGEGSRTPGLLNEMGYKTSGSKFELREFSVDQDGFVTGSRLEVDRYLP